MSSRRVAARFQTRLRPAAAGLALLTGLPMAGEAWAQRALDLTAEETDAYGRLVARWGDGDETAPNFTATTESSVLVLRFDEPITTDFSLIPETLPNWVALARLDPDGKALRLALKQSVDLHRSTSIDLAAIDLTPEGADAAPPAIVSPLVAARAAQAEAARIAAIPPPVDMVDMQIRAADAGDRTRLAFYWDKETDYEVTETADQIRLKFDYRAEPDLARLRIYPPNFIDALDASNDDLGFEMILEPSEPLVVTHYRDGSTVIVDLLPEANVPPPAPEPEPTPEPETATTSEPAVVEPVEAPTPQASAPKPTERPVVDKEIAAATPPPLVRPPADAAPIKAAARKTEEIAAQTLENLSDYADKPIVSASTTTDERATRLRGGWPDPAPKSGELTIKIRPMPNGLELIAPWDAPAPASVFQRGSDIWAVFAAKANLNIDASALPAGFKVEPLTTNKASVLRISAPEGMAVSAVAEGPQWTIQIAPTGVPPERFVEPSRQNSNTGRASIRAKLIGAAGVVWLDDPVIGDRIAAVVAFGPSSASPAQRNFIEAQLLPTAHGLAVAPKSDDVAVTVVEETVSISVNGGLAITNGFAPEALPGYTAMTVDTPTPGFIDFDAWGGYQGGAWFRRQHELERAVAARDQASRAGSEVLMELARFYVAHDMGPEALAVLRVVLDGQPLATQDPRFLALRGAANVMVGRYDEVEADLSRGALRGDASAALWRGYVAAELSEWERAREFFSAGEDLIHVYTPRWAARFYAASAEAAFRANNFDLARRHAMRADNLGYREPKQRAALVMAHLAGVTDGPDAAYARYSELARSSYEPIAVRAELKRLELGGELGLISATDAAEQLEALRYRWRGDDVEMQTIGILADQHMRLGRFREALNLAQSTSIRNPDAPGARDLRVRLLEYFRTLYLDGEADRLDPIQALALFYEFRSLTPFGADGDRMIRKLARRLVAFDLLEPATELLQHQVDNRVRGVGKASIASDLASIYLMNREPDRALAAINASRQPSLPRELALERRILEAAALRDLGRYDHTIELLEGVDGQEAASLRADAYWQDGKWPEASQELSAMLRTAKTAPGEKDQRADIALRTAIAGRMAKDLDLLADLQADYADLFVGHMSADSFNLLTSQTDVSGAALSEAVRRLADAPRVDAFAESIQDRFATGGDAADGS